jgi:hypothetical protein
MSTYTTQTNGKDITLKIEDLNDGRQKVIIAARNAEGKGGSHSIVLEKGVKVLLYRKF